MARRAGCGHSATGQRVHDSRDPLARRSRVSPNSRAATRAVLVSRQSSIDG